MYVITLTEMLRTVNTLGSITLLQRVGHYPSAGLFNLVQDFWFTQTLRPGLFSPGGLVRGWNGFK